MVVYHKDLANGRWQRLSFNEQMGNIGSEVSRARRWQGRDDTIFQGAFKRALELLDLTIKDPRWRDRLKELVRVREFLADAYFGRKEYHATFEDLDRYFFTFAYAARKK